jgi:hypothetical protein
LKLDRNVGYEFGEHRVYNWARDVKNKQHKWTNYLTPCGIEGDFQAVKKFYKLM